MQPGPFPTIRPAKPIVAHELGRGRDASPVSSLHFQHEASCCNKTSYSIRERKTNLPYIGSSMNQGNLFVDPGKYPGAIPRLASSFQIPHNA